MSQHQTTSAPLCALTIGLALSLFCADLVLPVGIATSISYVAVVLLAARSAWQSFPALAALGCTGLIIFGWVYTSHGSFAWIDVTNRSLGLCTLLVAVYLRPRRQHAEECLAQCGAERMPGTVPTPQNLPAEMPTDQNIAASPQQRDWLGVALESLGEAVITTDTRLTITFFNQAAEKLTGWHAADTYGRSLPSILRLLDEPTRQPMLVPLDQVVQQGIVTGLGEQTLLMRPDGFVRAIAGCG